MATLAVMKSRIADELARSDLTNQIGYAIQSAIEHYESERFWFNESRSITFSTVAAQVEYAAAANAFIPYLARIDALFLYESTTTFYPLDRYAPPDFEAVSFSATSGKPTCFTYSESKIRLWPSPDAVYSMRAHAVYKLTAISADGDTNAWTTEAEELIRSSAKRRLYGHVIRDWEAAAAMGVAESEALARLRTETSSRTGLGIIRPTEF